MKNLVGSTVRITSDNECYLEWMDRDLIIEGAINSVSQSSLYDESMEGMYLCDLTCSVTGEEFPFSLYEYEFEVL